MSGGRILIAGSRIKVGDLIAFRLDADRYALGHVIDRWNQPGFYYIAFFGPLQGKVEDLNLTLDSPRLLGLTTDSRVKSGHWQVLANRKPSPRIDLPAFQVSEGTVDNVMVEDFSGTRKRPATPNERRTLPHRTVSSPMLAERAMRAIAGLEPWIEAFDDLRPIAGATTKSMFDE